MRVDEQPRNSYLRPFQDTPMPVKSIRLLPCALLVIITADLLACSTPIPPTTDTDNPAINTPKALQSGSLPMEEAAQLLIDGRVLQTGKQLLFDLIRGELSAKEIAEHGKDLTCSKKALSEAEKKDFLSRTVPNGLDLDKVVVGITATSLPYQQVSSNGKPVAIVNFADSKLFYGFYQDDLFVQDEIMIANLFHLSLWRMANSTDGKGEQGKLPANKKICAGESTALFKNVPQYAKPINITKDLYDDGGGFSQYSQKAKNNDAEKAKLKNLLQNSIDRGGIDIHNPPKVNVLAMAAPDGPRNRNEWFYYTACCGFSQADGYVLTGNWGAGVFNKDLNKDKKDPRRSTRLSAKAQIAAAIATNTQIEVHAYSPKSLEEWKKAKQEIQEKINDTPGIKLIDLLEGF